VLSDAGVVDKHREGAWAFFDLVGIGPIGSLVRDVLARIDPHDPTNAADLDRLAVIQARRATAAQEYFSGIAASWDQERSLHAPDAEVEAAIVELVGVEHRSLLDIGTGTGRMLLLLGQHAERAVGLDTSHSMLAVARANLERAELRHVDLRQGDIYSPPFDRASFELIVIHQVLHFLDDPARALHEAARLLAPGGRLVIADFAPHALEFLRTEHAHRRLGFRGDTITGWLTQAGLDTIEVRTIAPPGGPSDAHLTVSLWLARKPKRDASENPLTTTLASQEREQ
jgi:ArsR family transcriptional regulator